MMRKSLLVTASMLGVATMAASAPLAAGGSDAAAKIEDQVEGLWSYTGLATSDGVERPLAGIFLFRDGFFLQQAVFEGEPFSAQAAMAHAGPYRALDDRVHLIAEQTISTAPGQGNPLSFRADTEHDVTVERDGDDLTLVFSMGTGTVQRFERLGPGEGEVYPLADGALALVDDHFILVEGDGDAVVSGYGTYERDGEVLTLEVIRWTEADQESATNRRDTQLTAIFDGETLRLEDGRSFTVLP